MPFNFLSDNQHLLLLNISRIFDLYKNLMSVKNKIIENWDSKIDSHITIKIITRFRILSLWVFRFNNFYDMVHNDILLTITIVSYEKNQLNFNKYFVGGNRYFTTWGILWCNDFI